MADCTIYMPDGEIHATRYASFMIWRNADVIINTVKVLDEGEDVKSGVGLTPIGFVNSSSFAKIKCYISNFHIDTTIGQTGYIFYPSSKKYYDINFKVDKVIYKHDKPRVHINCITNIRRGVERNLKCEIYIGEIDLSECKNGTIHVFSGTGTLSSEVKSNNLHSNGSFEFILGSIKNPNDIALAIMSNTNNGDIDVIFNNSVIEGSKSHLLRNVKTSFNSKIKLTGKVKTNSTIDLLNLRWSVEKADTDTVEILLEYLKLTNEGTGRIFSTFLYDDGSSSLPMVNPRIVFRNCQINTNNYLGVIVDIVGNLGTIENSSVLFFGENRFDVNQNNYLLDRAAGGGNHSLFPNAVVNYGKIFHNALNADYSDTRAIQKKENIYTYEI